MENENKTEGQCLCKKPTHIGGPDIFKALTAAKKDIPAIQKDADNPYFKSKYATLDAITKAITKPLAERGLMHTFRVDDSSPAKILIEAIICHEGGETLSSGIMAFNPTKADPQGQGSALTYGMRYTLTAVLGLSTVEDDDGNAASQSERGQRKPPSKKKTPPPEKPKEQPSGDGKASEAQVRAIQTLLSKQDVTDVHDRHVKVSELIGLPDTIPSFNDLTSEQASKAIDALQADMSKEGQ
jgi:hypothetical protein